MNGIDEGVPFLVIILIFSLGMYYYATRETTDSVYGEYDVITGNMEKKVNLDNVLETPEEFIENRKITIERIRDDYGIYPSVMIAQAMLESDFGRSKLAIKDKNYFGIKGEYKGRTVNYLTSEEDKEGNKVQIEENFRNYPDMFSSFEDYAKLITEDKLYEGAKKSTTKDYKESIKEIAKYYATDSHYEDKLNTLIEKYDLTKYD